MEKGVEQAATRRLSERGPPRVAAAGPGNRPTAGHLGIEQEVKVELCKGWCILCRVKGQITNPFFPPSSDCLY